LSNFSRKLTYNGVRLIEFLTFREKSDESENMYDKFKAGKYDKIKYTDYSIGKKEDDWKYETETGGVFIDDYTINEIMRKPSKILVRTKDMVDDPTVWDEPIKVILTSDEEKAAAAGSGSVLGTEPVIGTEPVPVPVLGGGKRRSKSSNKPKKSAKRVRTAKRSKYRRTRRQRK
jgi:hypothetical protein